ncbi:hypothetical protein [Actinokineospora diospyrosa]|uniref:Immunity protein 8 of polymorphic toxin system n=1 Tax=Actinokineospora diospyrosa TaxID=103728 RepID=A0ABT1IGV6_9PSEU|nr:hypothetical protein [Actinokineospora diospyrosa]MCP2271501.1 hypothetical protein [Actinokineospora diospyrosa]
MHFDYDLVPAVEFTSQVLADMADRLADEVTHGWSADFFTVFSDEDDRAMYLPYLLEHVGEPDWVNGYVKLEPSRVVLGVVHDDGIRRRLHGFAVWCLDRWPDTVLEYFGEQVAVDTLLPPED